MTLTVWESGNDVKNRLAAEHPGKHAVDWLQIFTLLNLHISFTIDQKLLGVYIWGLFREFYRKV